MKVNRLFHEATQWLSKTPERSLNQAYRAAFKIKEIEDKHFQGKPVVPEYSQYGENVSAYFETEVKAHLQTISRAITTFKASRLFISLSEGSQRSFDPQDRRDGLEPENSTSILLKRLEFVDQVTSRYKEHYALLAKESSHSLAKYSAINSENILPDSLPNNSQLPRNQKTQSTSASSKNLINMSLNEERRKLGSATEKTGVIPRSFMNTINRIKQEIDPKSEETEEEILKHFRSSRYKTAISIKFILLLIIVPLLTHQLTKTFVLTPVVENYFLDHDRILFINQDLEEEAFVELQRFEESLHFKGLIGLIPKLSEEEIEEKVKEKAKEISQEYRRTGINAISNIFADILSFISFAIVLIFSRQEVEIVKSFLDGILYNLSDSAKAFLIILSTDMFVGFHSPHGWEVILEGIARHFGLPENRQFNFLFIATFPVILDTVLKYWIFRYLNRISPSAVATYRNMNE